MSDDLLRKNIGDPELLERMDAELRAQVADSFSHLLATDQKLTQYSFLVNSGGAAAVLAFLGAAEPASFAWWPLGCFLVGAIASGLELRFHLWWLAELNSDAARRQSEFHAGTLPFNEAVPSPEIGKWRRRIHHWSGLVAQATFPLGVLAGAVALACTKAA